MDAHHPQQPQSPNMMVMGNSYPAVINQNSAGMMSPTALFPFNSMVPQPQAMDGAMGGGGNAGFDGSSSLRFNVETPAKKKRGRPRKYAPDGNISLGLAPSPAAVDSSGGGGGGTVSGGGGGSADAPSKRNRGRPPGSGKKQNDPSGAGAGFTPHILTVQPGEDIAAKILAFAHRASRTVCILSASGMIGHVTIKQPASGGSVTYEGRFEIITLQGSFLYSEENGTPTRNYSLSVFLAGSDGQVLGGGVVGMLQAASTVHVIVGSFISDIKKNSSAPKPVASPASAPNHSMVHFSAPVQAASPSSQAGGGSSDSSDDSGSSPLNHGPGLYNPGPPVMQNMHMYHPIWTGQTPQ